MRGRGRGRGRGRPARPLFHTRSELINKNIFIKKPTYLREKDDGSRASTPGGIPRADSEDNIASRSRSSSVTRSSLGTITPRKKHKIKIKFGASTSADTSQDYYYGSDFENLSDLEEVDGAEDNDSDDSDSDRSVYNADDIISESELSLPSSAGAGQDYVAVSRPPTPVPVWLQDRELPELVLPSSSEDLLIPREHILQTCAVYEVLRHFRTQIFLSPFTLEDFSAALLAEQQSRLLSEVHFQMLRLILRGNEKEQVHFGPQDLKDSINSVLYLSDIMTWPETLRVYLHTWARTRENVREVLQILDNNEYPFVPFKDRLKVLQLMVDMVLATPFIRHEFQRDGPIVYDDHCRSCHKLGDLLCCETCPATYHLECVNPPLNQVPDHDWQCEICRKHQVKGVTDCVSDMEKNGAMSRQEVLGYDRHGRRYWFLCRRIFIEEPDNPSSVVYYSTPSQYAALLSVLDRSDFEDALCMSLQELHYDIQRQMALTEEMTEQRLKPGRKSYIQMENDRLKAALETGEKKSDDAEGPGELKTEAEATDEQNATEGGSAGGGGGGGGGDAPSSSEVAESGDKTKEETKTLPARTLMVTRTKSGALPSKTVVKEEPEEEEEDGRKTTEPFKLGDTTDRSYQRYENQYTANPLALNRFQLGEDKDKRRHMSHKFSLTQASEFEWSGVTFGTRQQLRQTLRQTLQELVTRLPPALMHPSWPQLKRAWTAAVTGSCRPQDFARALTVISALIKPRLLCTVWMEALAHVSVQRVTPLEREEKKKAEKREKRERDEEELAQLRIPFVKYNLRKVKHQVWKQRGEEYRIHGQTGWLWLSNTRRYRPVAARGRGHAAGPHRVHVTLAAAAAAATGNTVEGENGDSTAAPTTSASRQRGVWVPFSTYRRLLDQQISSGGPSDRLTSLKVKPGTSEPQPNPDAPSEMVQIADPPPLPQPDDVVDVSAALGELQRTQLPRCARPGKLDKLLVWREELERRERGGEDADEEVVTEDGRRERAREELAEAERRLELLTVYPCYSRGCREGRPCYSPSCREMEALHQRIQRLRVDAVKMESNDTDDKPDTNDTKTDAKNDTKTDGKSDTKADAKSHAKTNDKTNTKASTKTTVKTGKMDVDEPSKELKPPRFAGIPTSAPVKLEVIRPVVKKNYVRYPLYSKFRAGGRWSMLVLPAWELKQLARRRGQKVVDGFNYAAKNNSQIWPYPCPRASLRTGWLYRTSRVPSLHAAGLQLRILWACVRWDDIDSRPQQVGPGEFQITTDTGMVRSLVLKHRDEGRFRERTMYYRRRVTILFDNPVIVEKEYTSSARSGLRKRRRVIESSENPSSAVTQEWVPEEALEIFEIKYYHEKVERLRQERQQAALQKRAAGLQTPRAGSPAASGPGSPATTTATTTTASTTAPTSTAATPALSSTVLVTGAGKKGITSAAQLKSKLEEAVRQSRTLTKGTKFMVKPSNAAAPTQGGATQQRTYTAMRKLITKDGKIIAIQSAPPAATATATATAAGSGSVTVSTGSPRAGQPPLAPAPAAAATAAPAATAAATITVAAPAAGAASPGAKQNQIQIIKLPDGKLQVKGLKPGQQLVQLPSGQLQLVSAGGTAKSLQAVTKQPAAVVSTPTTPKLRLVAPAGTTTSPVVSPVQSRDGSPAAERRRPGSIRIIRVTVPAVPALASTTASAANPASNQASGTATAASDPTSATAPAAAEASTGDPASDPVAEASVLAPDPDPVSATTEASPEASAAAPASPPRQTSRTVLLVVTPSFTWQDSTGAGGQRVVQKMVTQVVDLAGLSKPQLVGWQQKINEGKAKLALVNGRRVILHNVVVNQSLSTDSTTDPATLTTGALLREATDQEGHDEDDPPPAPEGGQEEVRQEQDTPAEGAEAAPAEGQQESEVKPELSPGRRITATANIVQTVAGPRVVIQGVPTQGLSQSQLHNLQQQVKAELAKGPMLTGLREIHLTVPADVPEPPPPPAAPVPPPTAVRPVPVQTVPAAVPAVPAGQSLLQPAQRQSLLSPRRVSESGPAAAAAAVGQTTDESAQPSVIHQDFTVTQEYIQQSINNALNSDNLKPEIAEKLLQLRKKPAAGGGDDGQGQTRPAAAAAAAPGGGGGGGQPPKKRPKTDRPPRQPSTGRARPRAEKRIIRPSARLQQLVRRKEQLKKEILRKRLHMENQLQLEISKQLAAYRRALAEEREGGRQEATGRGRQRRDSSPRQAAPAGRRSNEHRRKSEDSGRKRKSSTSRGSPGVAGRPAKKAKKEAKESPRDSKKLYCICRQPYDPTKFYVGCDMCSNWYHGSCVGLSQRHTKKVKTFVCQQCQSAKENRELFCFCRTEYDESQFYIGCDTCEDWFHGRCVGILPSEGDDIDDYVCPRCEPGSRINGPNFRPLTDANYAELRRVFKQIKNNRNAWPFIEPVDPDEVPNYYKVIKEPMDLQTIANRLESRHYGRLCDFTGDMIVVLDNCKYFNPPGTRLATCGTNLEAFFRAELRKLRTKI